MSFTSESFGVGADWVASGPRYGFGVDGVSLLPHQEHVYVVGKLYRADLFVQELDIDIICFTTLIYKYL